MTHVRHNFFIDLISKRSVYPNVATCARKWLSLPATLTPSGRIFSICGITNTVKRNSFSGKSIENQVFIHCTKHII